MLSDSCAHAGKVANSSVGSEQQHATMICTIRVSPQLRIRFGCSSWQSHWCQVGRSRVPGHTEWLAPMAKTDDGRSRLVVRFPYEDAVLIARAAAAVKTGVSEFVVQAAVDRARRVLKQSKDAD